MLYKQIPAQEPSFLVFQNTKHSQGTIRSRFLNVLFMSSRVWAMFELSSLWNTWHHLVSLGWQHFSALVRSQPGGVLTPPPVQENIVSSGASRFPVRHFRDPNDPHPSLGSAGGVPAGLWRLGMAVDRSQWGWRIGSHGWTWLILFHDDSYVLMVFDNRCSYWLIVENN